MKVLLIDPSSSSYSELESTDKKNMQKLSPFHIPVTLPYLAGLTPSDIDVKLAIDMYQDIETSFDIESFDLVGITCNYSQLGRTKEILNIIKKYNKRTVVGGPATVEDNHRLVKLLAHWFDAVVIGESEETWPRLLCDVKSDEMKRIYYCDHPASLAGLPFPKNDLIDFDRYDKPFVLPVMTARGCYRHCSFCSEWLYGPWRLRPVDEVIKEIAQNISKYDIHKIAFRDDNFFSPSKSKRTKYLLQKLIDLDIEWSCQTDLSITTNLNLIEFAIKSGLRSISLGLESILGKNLIDMNKNIFNIRDVETLLLFLHSCGIETQINVIFGFDEDTTEIFDQTVDFLLKNKVSLFYSNILCPIPGTKIYSQLKREGRLIDPHPLEINDPLFVNYIPNKMTTTQLIDGYIHARKRFYNEREHPIFWIGEKNNIWGTLNY